MIFPQLLCNECAESANLMLIQRYSNLAHTREAKHGQFFFLRVSSSLPLKLTSRHQKPSSSHQSQSKGWGPSISVHRLRPNSSENTADELPRPSLPLPRSPAHTNLYSRRKLPATRHEERRRQKETVQFWRREDSYYGRRHSLHPMITFSH